MSTELLGIARVSIHEGKSEEYKRLTERCKTIVETRDTGTLEYAVFLNADETEAVVIERYADSKSVIEHLENIGEELMSSIQSVADLEGETLGEPSQELLDYMKDTEVRFLKQWFSV